MPYLFFFEDHTFSLLTVSSINDTVRTIIFRRLRRTLHVLQVPII